MRADRGAPVSGATVIVTRKSGAVATREAASHGPLETNAAGWFAFDDLDEGDWAVAAFSPDGSHGEARVPVFDNATSEVTVRLNGFQRWIATLGSPTAAQEMADVSSGDATHEASVATAESLGEQHMPTGGVRGRVVYASSGNPVEGAAISIVRGAGPAPDIAPLTDSDGRFALDGLPPGTWELLAVTPEGAEATAEIQVYDSAVADVRISVERTSGQAIAEGVSLVSFEDAFAAAVGNLPPAPRTDDDETFRVVIVEMGACQVGNTGAIGQYYVRVERRSDWSQNAPARYRD